MMLMLVGSVTFTNFALAYEKENHYWLKMALALNCGFTIDEARVIATGDWNLDEDPETAPVRTGSDKDNPKWKWHALPTEDPDVDKDQTSSGNQQIKQRQHDLYNRALNEKDTGMRLFKFGQYLHYEEDKWSHWGYTTEIGHAVPNVVPGMTSPDQTHANPETYRYMVFDSMVNLGKLAKSLGKNTQCVSDLVPLDTYHSSPEYGKDFPWVSPQEIKRSDSTKFKKSVDKHLSDWGKTALINEVIEVSKKKGDEGVTESFISYISTKTGISKSDISKKYDYIYINIDDNGDTKKLPEDLVNFLKSDTKVANPIKNPETATRTNDNTAVSAGGNNVNRLSANEIKSIYKISKLQESAATQLSSVNDQQKSILQKATSVMNKDLSKEKKDQLKLLLKTQDSDKKDIKTIQDYTKKVSAAIKKFAQKQGLKGSDLDKAVKTTKTGKQAKDGPVSQLKQDAADAKDKIDQARKLQEEIDLAKIATQIGNILPDSEGRSDFEKRMEKQFEEQQARESARLERESEEKSKQNVLNMMQRLLDLVQKKEEIQTGSILNTIPDTPTKDHFVSTTPTKDTPIQVRSKHSSYAQSNNSCVDKRAKILATWVLSGVTSGKASVMITNLDVDPDTVPLNFLNADVRDGTIQYEFTVPGPGHYEVSIWSIDKRPVSGGSMNITVPDSCGTATPPPVLVEPSSGITQSPAKTNTKPSLTIPKSITKEATGPSGAVVNFVATGQDKEDGILTPSCSYPSDYMFPIGTTTVSCTVDDSDNNSISGTFTVTIRDTTPPVFSPFQATQGVKDESGVQMFFDVIAVDAVDGGVQVSCDYQSGYKFPPGVTTMTCTASDSKGNLATKKVQITVTVTQSGQ